MPANAAGEALWNVRGTSTSLCNGRSYNSGLRQFPIGASLLANAAGSTLWNVRGQGRSYKPRLRQSPVGASLLANLHGFEAYAFEPVLRHAGDAHRFETTAGFAP